MRPSPVLYVLMLVTGLVLLAVSAFSSGYDVGADIAAGEARQD